MSFSHLDDPLGLAPASPQERTAVRNAGRRARRRRQLTVAGPLAVLVAAAIAVPIAFTGADGSTGLQRVSPATQMPTPPSPTPSGIAASTSESAPPADASSRSGAVPTPASIVPTRTTTPVPTVAGLTSAVDGCAEPGPLNGSCTQDIEVSGTGPKTATTGEAIVVTVLTTWSAEQPADLVDQNGWCWESIGGDDGFDPQACDNPDRVIPTEPPGCTVTEAPRPAVPGSTTTQLTMSFDRPGKYFIYFSPATSCTQYWQGIYPGGFGYITVTDPAAVTPSGTVSPTPS